MAKKNSKKKEEKKKLMMAFFLLFIFVVAISMYKGGSFNAGGTPDGDNPGGNDDGWGLPTTTQCDPTHAPGCPTPTTLCDPTHAPGCPTTTTTRPSGDGDDYTCINRAGEEFGLYDIEWQQCGRLWQYRLCEWGTWSDWSACIYDDPNDQTIIA